MSPLGLGLSISGATKGDSSVAVVTEDYMWEPLSSHPTPDRSLTPLASGTVSDFHDTWDLFRLTSGEMAYQPQTTATVGSEGYWVIGSPADETDTDYIRPVETPIL